MLSGLKITLNMVNLANNEVNVTLQEFNISAEVWVLSGRITIRASKTLQKFESLITGILSLVILPHLEKVFGNQFQCERVVFVGLVASGKIGSNLLLLLFIS
jgi:hypothetical protein